MEFAKKIACASRSDLHARYGLVYARHISADVAVFRAPDGHDYLFSSPDTLNYRPVCSAVEGEEEGTGKNRMPAVAFA